MKIKNSNIFRMPGNPHMWHLATATEGLREYVAMVCLRGPHKGKVYVEELVATNVDFNKDVYGNFRFIEDDVEAYSATSFFKAKGMLEVQERFEQMVWSGMLNETDWLTEQDIKELGEALGVRAPK